MKTNLSPTIEGNRNYTHVSDRSKTKVTENVFINSNLKLILIVFFVLVSLLIIIFSVILFREQKLLQNHLLNDVGNGIYYAGRNFLNC